MIPHFVFLSTILDYFMCLDYATLYLWRFLFYFKQSTKLLKKLWIFYPYSAFILLAFFNTTNSQNIWELSVFIRLELASF